MSEIIRLEKKISLPSEFLDQKIRSHLLNRVRDVFKNDCTKEYGYILNIKKLLQIKSNYISSVNSENMFHVELKAEVVKPEIGKIFEDEICMIFNGGIFINVYNKFKVLIPINYISEYNFQAKDRTFQHSTDEKKIIKEGDIIKVKINGIKYANKQFSCFGEMIENKEENKE